MAVFQAWLMAAPGAEKKLPHACSTVVLVNAFSRPPITMAVKMARKITVTELPSSIDSLRVWPNDLRRLAFSSCFVAVAGPGEAGDSGGPGGACSLMSSLPLLPGPLRGLAGAVPGLRGSRGSSLDPAISRPSSSTGTEGGRKPVIRPSYMTAIRSASA